MKRLTGWLGVVVLVAFSQDVQERFRAMSAKAELAGLAEPFRGVTAKGTVEPGLFTIRSTGVSTEPVRKAAVAFLDGLTAGGNKEANRPTETLFRPSGDEEAESAPFAAESLGTLRPVGG